MDQASQRAVPARADDEQVQRAAVDGEFFGGRSVGGVRLDVAETRDPFARSLHGFIDGLPERPRAGVGSRATRYRLEGR